MIVLDSVLFLISSFLLLPVGIYCVECLVAVLNGVPPPLSLHSKRPRLAIVIPAHNEQDIIGNTVRHVQEHLGSEQQITVVADNCSDATMAEARDAGAEVWIRTDPDHRGKGYAIEFAINRLAADPPEVLVLIDADCRLSHGAIDLLSRAATTFQRPVQARYLMAAPKSAGSLASVSALAYLVRNLVRPLGLHWLGFPCHLTGTGMAFVWAQIRAVPGQRDHLVEDLVMGLDLAIAGHPPLYCHEALVWSELPESRGAAAAQRRRWEHGQMATLWTFVPKLLSLGIRRHRADLVVLAADLAVPPLALLVTLVIAAAVAGGLAFTFGASPAALVVSVVSMVLIGLATIASWARFGREQVPFSTLALVPVYLVWKLPLYVAFFIRRRQKEWVRTERTGSKLERDDE